MIVPVYNEEKTLRTILEKLLAVPIVREIIVVDDGSKDRTAAIADDIARERNAPTAKPPAVYPTAAVDAASHELPIPPRIKVMRHDHNRGKGAAIRTGLIHVSNEVTVVQDGDLEYDPRDFEKMMDVIESGASVVYGSRILGKNRFSYRRYYFGGRFLSVVARVLYRLKITDEPTCYKMVKTDLLRKMNLQCERFEFCPEVTAKAARLGQEIIEVPISYAPRSIDEGKKIRWYDGIEAIWTLLRYRLWRPL